MDTRTQNTRAEQELSGSEQLLHGSRHRLPRREPDPDLRPPILAKNPDYP